MYLEIVARSIHSKLVRIRLTDKPWFSTEIRKRNKYSESLIPLTARGNHSNPSL